MQSDKMLRSSYKLLLLLNIQKEDRLFIMKRLLAAVLALLLPLSLLTVSVFAYSPSDTVSYMVCTGEGWQQEVTSTPSNAETAGNPESNTGIHGLCVKAEDKDGSSMIRYCVYINNLGWQSWMLSGNNAGSPDGKNLPEALKIELFSQYAEKYDILYRTYLKDEGWMNWAKNGEISGSEDMGLVITAVEIKLVKKDSEEISRENCNLIRPELSYCAKPQNRSWSGNSKEDTACPKNNSSLLEGFKILLKDQDNGSGVSYNALISQKGWQGEKSSGTVAGGDKGSSVIEAIKIRLSPSLKKYFDIYYSVCVPGKGWLGWAKNGEAAGTANGYTGITAVKIKLLNRNEKVRSDKAAFVDYQNYTTESYRREVNSFIHDSRWSDGSYWCYGQYPTISFWSCIGCCAYAADFVKYVFGMDDPGAGELYTDSRYIRSGDVLYFVSDHWVCVLYRKGSTLITAEGNWGGEVIVSSDTYYMVGDTVYRDGEPFRTFAEGYHYL